MNHPGEFYTLVTAISALAALASIIGVVYMIIRGARNEKRLAIMESNHIATLDTRVNNLYTLFGELKKDIGEFRETFFHKCDEFNEHHKQSDIDRARMDERLKSIEEKLP